MAKRVRKTKVVDVKKAAANDKETPVVKLPAKTASAVAKGAAYAVPAVFGKTGYAYSWVKRAEVLGVSTEELCGDFKSDPAGIKVAWEKATAK